MRLPTIRDFAREATMPGCYTALGPDWSLAVADVVGSTRLASEGRYREVNFVAGAVIAVLSEVLRQPPTEPACQFSGDGAIAAVPPGCRSAAADALAALADWAGTELDVPLRVGIVPVADLLDAGLEVMVALQDFGNGNVFGHFLGSGVAAAEAWVKADLRRQITPRPGLLPGLEGLSCRWEPVPTRHGTILCVIADPVAPGDAGLEAITRLQAEIEHIVSTETAAPLGRGESLVPHLPSMESLRLEVRTEPPRRRAMRVVRAVAGAGLMWLGHRTGLRVGALDVPRYRRALAERSDYRKEAGGPRYVLDVTAAQADAIEALLERFAKAGEILYGTARAEATTITCLVGDFAADRHVHFVDGAELGFWRASIQLKGMRTRKAEPAAT
ncbi:MAG TPA: DUF3095 family protein [Azospirillum sp.]|nr:DUF3095 family protein [Azospirillum sp.]